MPLDYLTLSGERTHPLALRALPPVVNIGSDPSDSEDVRLQKSSLVLGSLAANKVPGIRAALCNDAETAKGARIWNHANVLGLSLRGTPEPIAREILNAWFETPYSDDEWNQRQIQRIKEIEQKYGKRRGGK